MRLYHGRNCSGLRFDVECTAASDLQKFGMSGISQSLAVISISSGGDFLDTTTFSLAIVNWNTRDLLDDCLASIRAVKGSESVEVLVADNLSSDGSAEMVTEKYPEVNLIRNSDNLGFAGGHATLFPHSTGKYHVLINSDVRLEPGCLEIVRKRMESDPQIGILGCRITGPDQQIQPSCRRFPTLWRQLIDASGINRIFARSSFWNAYKMGDFDHLSSREVDQVMGSFFVIRRELIEKIGVLDTNFFMYYEEVDYCLRARKAGFKIFYEADAVIWHKGGGSSDLVRVHTIRRTMRSMRHYYRKHYGMWTWLPLMAIVSLDTVTHVLYALFRRRNPLQTLKAYGLGLLDVVVMKRADT